MILQNSFQVRFFELRLRLTHGILFWLFLTPYTASGEVFSYSFSGTVILAPSTAYGNSIPGQAPVQGRFSYDTASVGAASGATTNYSQNITNGLYVTFGGLAVSASSYEIAVSHDLLQPNGSYQDVFSVLFSSNASPAPSAPLIVGGVSENVGLLSVSLLGPPTLFPGAVLPTSLNLSNFTTELGRFSQTPTGLVDVVFSASSLQAIPEPSGALLAIIGGLVAIAAGRLLRRRRID
jgi:hypothetical protein